MVAKIEQKPCFEKKVQNETADFSGGKIATVQIEGISNAPLPSSHINPVLHMRLPVWEKADPREKDTYW
jgi:hypothetical protein